MIYPTIVVRYIGTTRTKLLVMPLCRLNMNARIQCGFIAQLAEHNSYLNIGYIAQVVEHKTENLGVRGANPCVATIKSENRFLSSILY